MKKLLVIGDIHGETYWKKLIANHENDVDHVCFVGDYVDSFSVNPGDIITNLAEIINLKAKNPDKFTLLLGNHDAQYLWLQDWEFRCSGFNSYVASAYNYLFQENKSLFQLGLQVDTTFITHAGICQTWMTKLDELLFLYSLSVDITNIIPSLNSLLINSSADILHHIGAVGKSRGGYDPVGGIFWAGKSDLQKDYIRGVNQIVGHTHLKDKVPYQFNGDNGEIIQFIDIQNGALIHPTIIEYNEFT